jgi:hypothetical protein
MTHISKFLGVIFATTGLLNNVKIYMIEGLADYFNYTNFRQHNRCFEAAPNTPHFLKFIGGQV